MDPLKHQEGGDHYKKLKIQPIEYIHANEIPFAEGSVIKYVTRWRGKGGIADLKKARHFLDLLIDLETKAQAPSGFSAPAAPLVQEAPVSQEEKDLRAWIDARRQRNATAANQFASGPNPPGGA